MEANLPKASKHVSDVAAELRLHLKMLEEMFTDPDLTGLRSRWPNHPCVRRYDTIKQYVEDERGLTYPFDEAIQSEMAELMIDRSTWGTQLPGKSFWSFIDDESVRTQVEARIRNPDSYHDIIAEVFFWGWLRAEGVAAKLIEREGMPDLIIGADDPNPTYAEVKHLHVNSPSTRVRSVIKKANRQIKKANPQAAGIVFLRVAREGYVASLDDRIPSDVQPVLDEVTRSLQTSMNRSVARVIIAWDEYASHGEPPARTTFFFNRKFAVVDHPSPRSNPVVDARFEGGGRAVAMRVSFGPATAPPPDEILPSIKGRRAVVTQLFRQTNELSEGVRASHAMDALLNPDGLERHDIQGGAVILATRRITIARAPYTLLVIARQDAGQVPEIQSGYRIYDRSDEDAALAKAPFAAFMELLARFGIPVRVGATKSLFVRSAIVTLEDDTPVIEVERPSDEGAGMIAAFVRTEKGNPQRAHVAWAYALDKSAYRTDAAQRRAKL